MGSIEISILGTRATGKIVPAAPFPSRSGPPEVSRDSALVGTNPLITSQEFEALFWLFGARPAAPSRDGAKTQKRWLHGDSTCDRPIPPASRLNVRLERGSTPPAPLRPRFQFRGVQPHFRPPGPPHPAGSFPYLNGSSTSHTYLFK